MAKPSSWISHVESFVDPSLTSSQQAASIDAIASLVKNDLLTLENMVKEMEMYLITSDHVIRARGILLLAEIMTCLTSKPLDSTAISSLVGFFTTRLADWRALKGALLGCLALLSRKSNTGTVATSDAVALAHSFVANVDAHSLAASDRKLCFEVLQRLLDAYPAAAVTLGEELVYQICGAIDEEKDPRCLMLAFHLVETLAQLFPDPSGPVANFAQDLFEILGLYFPIDFTHPSDDFEIKRGDLSRALMKAFCSTPHFEPFAIPLLLDKLSSSLHSAKLDSLKYLNNCIPKYGADRMAKHAKVIWLALKDVTLHHFPEGRLPLSDSDIRVTEPEEDQIAKEALICLQTSISHLNCANGDTFLSLVLSDDTIEMMFASFSGEKSYSGIFEKNQHQLKVLGSFISVASKVSNSCCSTVFQKFFSRLMGSLGVSSKDFPNRCIEHCETTSKRLNFESFYLCVELLSSCRDLSMGDQVLSEELMSLEDSWWYMLKSFADPLTYVLGSALVSPIVTDQNSDLEYYHYIVKGLEILATFPGGYSPISTDAYENILTMLMSVITNNYECTILWKMSLKALVQIASFIPNSRDPQKEKMYTRFVIENIISLLPLDDSSISVAQKLEAISEIGTTGLNFFSAVIHGVEETIFSNFRKAYVEGDLRATEILVALLECYSSRVLPWCNKYGIFEGVALAFAHNIWDQIEHTPDFSIDKGKGVLDSMIMTMKLVVGGCTRENQSLILQKSYNILSSTTLFSVTESGAFDSSKLRGLPLIMDADELSCRDEWIMSLFASIVVALLPQISLPDAKRLTNFFLVLLLKGHIFAAHALASMINKWTVGVSKEEGSAVFVFDDSVEMIFDTLSSILCYSCSSEGSLIHTNELNSAQVCHLSWKINSIVGLAWFGKGLLMRGHDKVKDVTMLLLKHLSLRENMMVLQQGECENSSRHNMDSLVVRSIADTFHIFLSDSEYCLNKEFHAMIRPLYKQRFFSNVMPVFLSLIKDSSSSSSSSREVLFRAFGHVIVDTPLPAVAAEAKKLIPSLLDALIGLSLDILNKDQLYSLLLVLAAILMDENCKEAIIENAHIIMSHLIRLISYPHMMLVRETSIQCLVAMSGLPHTRIYPMRPKVLRAVSKALDDQKRAVRQEAVKCRQAWASIASRTLHF